LIFLPHACYPIFLQRPTSENHFNSIPISQNAQHTFNQQPNSCLRTTHKYYLHKILLEDSASIEELNTIAYKFLTTKQFTFYTDGSLINLQTPECKMGFGWIELTTNTTFKGATIFNPSSTKSETIAILTAIISVPNDSTLNIYTDSQNCINNWKTFSDPLVSRRKQLNKNNHNLWTLLKDLTKTKNLTINFIKVKAHSNDTFNDIADDLVKQGLLYKPIYVQPKAFTDSLLCPIWNHIGTIDTNPRKWIKKVLQSRIFTSFLFNNNLHSFRSNFDTDAINWEYTARWISRNINQEEITSFRHTRQVSHKIESITHNLPTSDLQKQRCTKLYLNEPILCPLCTREEDNNSHIGLCISTKHDINACLTKGKDRLQSLIETSEYFSSSSLALKNSLHHLACLQPLPLDNNPIQPDHTIHL
jgi:ribonuclease HI